MWSANYQVIFIYVLDTCWNWNCPVERDSTKKLYSQMSKQQKPSSYLVRLQCGAIEGPMSEDCLIANCVSRLRITSRDECARCYRFGYVGMWRPISQFPNIAPFLAERTIEQSEFSPPLAAQCSLWHNGQTQGPFTPVQIKSMWDAGSITADTLFYYSELPDWKPAASFCQNRKWEGASDKSAVLLKKIINEQQHTSSMVRRVILFLAAAFFIVR